MHASIVVDASTGRVLEAHNTGVRTYPASLTKLMTLYLVFSALEHGKLKLGQRLAVSAHAAAQSPTKLGLKPGTTITVRSAILGIVTRSANDAAVVLAEALGAEADLAQSYELMALACLPLGEWRRGVEFERRRASIVDLNRDVTEAADVHL